MENTKQVVEDNKEYENFLISPPEKIILKPIDDKDDFYEKKYAKSKLLIPIETEFKGEVVSVGKDVDFVKVGDIVYHNEHSGTIFKYNNNTYLSLEKYLILAVKSKKI